MAEQYLNQAADEWARQHLAREIEIKLRGSSWPARVVVAPAMLHEINHVIHDSVDAERAGEAGECEDLINRMRRECGLAERAEYYFTLLPGTTDSSFKTGLVVPPLIRRSLKREGRSAAGSYGMPVSSAGWANRGFWPLACRLNKLSTGPARLKISLDSSPH